jgi:hypothetical protein
VLGRLAAHSVGSAREALGSTHGTATRFTTHQEPPSEIELAARDFHAFVQSAIEQGDVRLFAVPSRYARQATQKFAHEFASFGLEPVSLDHALFEEMQAIARRALVAESADRGRRAAPVRAAGSRGALRAEPAARSGHAGGHRRRGALSDRRRLHHRLRRQPRADGARSAAVALQPPELGLVACGRGGR